MSMAKMSLISLLKYTSKWFNGTEPGIEISTSFQSFPSIKSRKKWINNTSVPAIILLCHVPYLRAEWWNTSYTHIHLHEVKCGKCVSSQAAYSLTRHYPSSIMIVSRPLHTGDLSPAVFRSYAFKWSTASAKEFSLIDWWRKCMFKNTC